MVGQDRESRLATTFVKLADTLVVGFDMVDLLQSLVETSAELLDYSAAGLVLSDGLGPLEPVASTNEDIARLLSSEISSGVGPTVECVTGGGAVDLHDFDAPNNWPDYSAQALSLGLRSVHAVPLRLRERVIGALAIYNDLPGTITATDSAIAQSLADVATISILQERALRESDIAVDQLQHALDSRVLIEQAKGVVSYVRNVGMDEAFALLRSYSRSNNVALREVASLVVNRRLEI
jgi:GAF domain-containing protein